MKEKENIICKNCGKTKEKHSKASAMCPTVFAHWEPNNTKPSEEERIEKIVDLIDNELGQDGVFNTNILELAKSIDSLYQTSHPQRNKTLTT